MNEATVSEYDCYSLQGSIITHFGKDCSTFITLYIYGNRVRVIWAFPLFKISLILSTNVLRGFWLSTCSYKFVSSSFIHLLLHVAKTFQHFFLNPCHDIFFQVTTLLYYSIWNSINKFQPTHTIQIFHLNCVHFAFMLVLSYLNVRTSILLHITSRTSFGTAWPCKSCAALYSQILPQFNISFQSSVSS